MRLRTRVMAAATLAVLITVALVSIGVYRSISHELHRQVDTTLQNQGDRFASFAVETGRDQAPTTGADGATGLGATGTTGGAESQQGAPIFSDSYLQALDTDGNVLGWAGEGKLPATSVATQVATGAMPATFEEVVVAGDRVRVYNVRSESGVYRFGRSLEEVDQSLQRLRIALVLVGLAGIALAALISRALATRAIAPVHALSDAARTIKATGDLSRRLPAKGADEVASVARSFNDLLDDLERSQATQRQLVADASHELRTPLATLRTNIDVLARGHDLPADERDRILDDLTSQLEDLTGLVGDLVDLARDATDSPPEQVRLDEVVVEVLDRARRQRPHLRFELESTHSLVVASPDRLERAVSNLVDNAAKWSPSGAAVTVTVARGTVAVADEGPGIDPADLDHIFDRFYRSPSARKMPGSGLGLAIVKQFADGAGGTVVARSEPGQGAVLTLSLRELWMPPPADWRPAPPPLPDP